MGVARFGYKEGIFWVKKPCCLYIKADSCTRPSDEGETQNDLVCGWTSEGGLVTR